MEVQYYIENIKNIILIQVTQVGKCHDLDRILLPAAAFPGATQECGLHDNWMGKASQSGCYWNQRAPQGHCSHHTHAELPQGLL